MAKYYTKASGQSSIKYMKDHQKKICVQYKKDYFESEIKPAVDKTGLQISSYIKKATDNRIAVEKVLSNHNLSMSTDEVSAFILEAVIEKLK